MIWIYSILIAFFLGSIIGPRMIPMLTRLKYGQFVREDGPESHLKKQGTPTMGGFIFLIAMIIGMFFFTELFDKLLPLFITVVAFGIIGFLDDFLKIKKKQSEGLTSKQKFGLQFVVAVAMMCYLVFVQGQSTEIIIPFTYGYTIDLSWFYIPAMIFVVLGTVNGVNFTDGVDGLNTSVTLVVAGLFIYLGMMVSGMAYVSVASGLVAGGLLAFLLVNAHPAKIFMGDLGSLALGGYVAYVAVVMQMPLFIILFGIIYLLEVISVIIQVGVYKRTKKRVFRMAPIHHHFELGGMSETQVVAFFSIVTLVMSLITLLAL